MADPEISSSACVRCETTADVSLSVSHVCVSQVQEFLEYPWSQTIRRVS